MAAPGNMAAPAAAPAPRELDGKVALITGAGRGLGRAFAERLAALGASVAIHGRRERGPAEFGEGTTLTATAAEIGQAFGVPSLRVLADLTSGEEVDRAVGEVVARFGRISPGRVWHYIKCRIIFI